MMQAHTQIDRTTVPVLADSLQNHRGGVIIFSSSPAAPDRCPGAPRACSRDSVGVRVCPDAGLRGHTLMVSRHVLHVARLRSRHPRFSWVLGA